MLPPALIRLIGFAIGICAAIASTVLLFPLVVCSGFFEQGCGDTETARLIGLALAAALIGGLVGWLAAALAAKLFGRK